MNRTLSDKPTIRNLNEVLRTSDWRYVNSNKRPRCGSVLSVLLLCFLTMALYSTASFGEEVSFTKFDSPQNFYIVSKSAETFSSPDETGYATGNLKRSEMVEAYGQVGAEWLAIRPPTGQYDWVPAQFAHLLPGGHLAEIIDSETPAFMHSGSEELNKLQWQIKLQPTQQVNVRGQHLQKLADGRTRAWYKIDPPPGEFRWIKMEVVSEKPPRMTIVKKSSAKEQTDAPKLVHQESEVKQASAVIVDVQNEPIHLGPGETIVDHDSTPLWDAGEGEEMIIYDPETMEGTAEGEFIVDETTGEIITADSSFGECAQCTAEGYCDDCEQDFGRPIHRLRPISRLLSCFGLAIVEAEPVGESSCGGCGLATCNACGTGSALITRAATLGSLPSRFDHLPRPTRSFQRGDVNDSILLDRLGDARRHLKESVDDAREGLASRQGSLLVDPARVTLGSPLRSALNRNEVATSETSTDSESWQGLPTRGVGSENLQLDVEAPTMADEWSRRPQTNAPGTDANGTAGGTLLQTSSPSNRDQGFREPKPSSIDDLRFSNEKLRIAAAELTSIVANPTEQWQLARLRQEVEGLIESGTDPVMRGEARLLLDRIDSFEDFRARWMRANSNRIVSNPNQDFSAPRPASPIQVASFQKPAGPTESTRVTIQNMSAAREIIESADASGWLVAVHSDRADYPKFALTDDAGRLIAYVESSPALNLRGYLQQPVAVRGQKGMNTLLNARSLYAERVIRIADAK